MKTWNTVVEKIEEHIGYIHEAQYNDDPEAMIRAFEDIWKLAKEGIVLCGGVPSRHCHSRMRIVRIDQPLK